MNGHNDGCDDIESCSYKTNQRKLTQDLLLKPDSKNASEGVLFDPSNLVGERTDKTPDGRNNLDLSNQKPRSSLAALIKKQNDDNKKS